MRRVAALGQFDSNGIAMAFSLVVAGQPAPDVPRLGAHDRVPARVESVPALESFDADRIFLELASPPLNGPLDHVAEEGLLPFGRAKRPARKDPAQLLANLARTQRGKRLGTRSPL